MQFVCTGFTCKEPATILLDETVPYCTQCAAFWQEQQMARTGQKLPEKPYVVVSNPFDACLNHAKLLYGTEKVEKDPARYVGSVAQLVISDNC